MTDNAKIEYDDNDRRILRNNLFGYCGMSEAWGSRKRMNVMIDKELLERYEKLHPKKKNGKYELPISYAINSALLEYVKREETLNQESEEYLSSVHTPVYN